jgi:uncharacterized membrane protein YtjA (UPF0391 family)
MLQWALLFLIAALIAAFAGFGGMLVAGAGAAKVLFFIFLSLFLFALISGSFLERPLT